MITELYNKLVKLKKEPKSRKVSVRDYFIVCYVKEAIH